ncbi:F0F1 ATP synthase subunit epsilon [Spiroplasma turonicum]|uniref:F0F1 ATP synthase subunit epsilon n=1 Tax=Spiroplasma turonicum TaxID=216946 RepID=A0A0K1P4T9_9MOLU|nr:F0F1 ATP synthase subunit epsilon [Spiroplasma turonicum]AKU79298.1 F0F1 ATP synthase subunit epsilon [Spiroplasma turonicum]ALX70321.1 F0F1 ATP synthase subunit epsilon [Spiroplasma turonicum]
MDKTLKLKIVTPEETYLDDIDVESITILTTAGKITVYSNHAPIVSTLVIGNMKYTINNVTKYIHLHRGILKISHNQVKIITQRLYEVDENGQRL